MVDLEQISEGSADFLYTKRQLSVHRAGPAAGMPREERARRVQRDLRGEAIVMVRLEDQIREIPGYKIKVRKHAI